MSANDSAPAPGADSSVQRAKKLQVSEDWIATIVGLGLLFLAMAGVITPDLIP